MLSAEHLALQSRLVQQLAAIKQKELDYLLGRYQAIGIQSALIAAGAMQTLVSLDPSAQSVNRTVTWIFFISSILCGLSCTYVTVCVLYIGNWAPGLALRGPTGSLNRALEAVMAERGQINFWFSFSLLTFVIQTVITVWVLNDTRKVTAWSIACSFIGVGAICYTTWYLMEMRKRFFRDESLFEAASRSVKNDGAPSVKSPLKGPSSPNNVAETSSASGLRPRGMTRGRGARPSIAAPRQSSAGRDRRVTIEMSASEQPNKPLLGGGGKGAHHKYDASARPARSSLAGRSSPPGKRASVATGNKGPSGNAAAGSMMALSAIAKLQARVRGNATRQTPVAKEVSRRLSERLSGPDPEAVRVAAAKHNQASAGAGGGRASITQASKAAAPSASRANQRRGSNTPVLDNPVALVFNNPDVAMGASMTPFSKSKPPPGAVSGDQSPFSLSSRSELELSGYMFKRVGMNTGANQGIFRSLRRGAAMAKVGMQITPSWQQRFFMLSGNQLMYWHTEEDCDEEKAPSATIDLGGYEVLVDQVDPNWGFELRPTLDKSRAWYFRAFTEEDRLEWVRRLVAATYVGMSTRSRKHSWW